MKRLLCASFSAISLYFYFLIGGSSTKKNFLKNLLVSHNFDPAVKMSSKLGKTVLIAENTILVLSFHFRRMFIAHFKRINCNDG